MEEIWKEIEETYGLYEVSSTGRVRNKEGHIMAQKIDKDGYANVKLSVFGKRLYRRVNRLVAIAFVPHDSFRTIVDHIDGNRQNNDYRNLRWVNASENSQKASRVFNKKRKIYCLEMGMIWESAREAAMFLNTHSVCAAKRISEVCKGLKKSYGGYHWKYVS